MANLYAVAQTVDNAGVDIAASALGFNKKATAGQGIAGATHICTVDLNGGGNFTQAKLDGFIEGLMHGEGLVTSSVLDAFTVVAIKGAVGDAEITVVAQGTGTPSTVAQEYFADVDITAVTTIPGISG
jgi:hypothetical protein